MGGNGPLALLEEAGEGMEVRFTGMGLDKGTGRPRNLKKGFSRHLSRVSKNHDLYELDIRRTYGPGTGD